jgi:hypothetical protein
MALKFSAKLFSAEKSCGKSAAGLKSLLYQLCKKYGSKIPREVFFRGKFAAGMKSRVATEAAKQWNYKQRCQ